MTSDQERSKALLDALQLESHDELQDLLCSLILSECVYKAVDSNHDAALDAISTFTSQFPPGAVVEISAVQFCRNRVSHKYLLATASSSSSSSSTSSSALYVAFMGTKELRDVAVDVAVGPRTLFTVHGGNARGGESITNAGGEEATKVAEESIVVAHGGFLSRAQGIPAASLLLHALKQNMRLVFCGHSLGGAVATLVMLRLLSSLQHLPAPHQLRCITFGMPALGTSALGVHIDTQGWGNYFTSYALPEDPVPRLHLSRSRINGASAGRDGGGSNGSSNGSMSEIRRKSGEESEEEELLVERLYQEETPSFDNVDNATLTEGNNDKPRWSVLREVARKARIAGAAIPRLISLPPFLSYAHFGTTLFLLSTGVSYSNKENSSSASTAPPATTAFLLPQGVLANHRMPAYRSRMLEICHKYHSNENLPNELNRNNTTSSKIKEVFNLAPSVTATTVETSLPILYTRPPPPGLEKYTMVVRVQGKGLDVCTGASLHFGGNSGGSGGGGGVPLTVFGRAVDVDKAKQLVVERTNQLLAGNNSNNEKEKAAAAAGGGGGRSLLQTLGEKFLPRTGFSSSNKHVDSTLPLVEFVFEVPVEALLQLQISSSSSIKIKMDLISDFAKTPVSVHCIPQTAWIFSLDTQLGDAVFSELVETAQQDAEGAAAAAAARGVTALSLQGRKNKQKRSSPQVDHNLAKDTEEKDRISTHEAETAPLLSLKDKIFQRLTKPIFTTLPLDSTSVVSFSPLRSVLYRGLLITDISNALNESTSIKKLQLAAELLQWTAAQRNGPSSSNSSSSNTDLWDDLEVPVHDHEYDSLLQKDQTLGTRLKQQLRRAISSVPLPLSSPPLLPSLPLLGKGAVNKHRIRLWEQLFKDLPVDSPNIVVILASGETLKNPVNKSKGTPSSSTALENKISGSGATSIITITTPTTTIANGSIVSNEFNLPLLDAMHAVAVASGQCHAAALLGVAASEAKDPAYRRRLSFSSGLYGRPGAVVPLDWQTHTLEKEKIEKERKRQPFLNVSMLQAALLAHASAAQISNLQNDSSETIRRDGDASVKSMLRARL